MKEIPLTLGKAALVDDSDYEWLSQWKWSAAKRKMKSVTTYYAARCVWNKGRNDIILMHRLILGCSDGQRGDHRDGDGLNNQRHNLRIATAAQNGQNKRGWNHSSRFKGVARNHRRQYWQSSIGIDNKIVNLGCFDHEIDAAIAYNEAAKLHFGEFANLNTIPESWVFTPARVKYQDKHNRRKQYELTYNP